MFDLFLTAAQCPKSWFVGRLVCYFFSETDADFNKADQLCRNMTSRLAHVRTPDEFDSVKTALISHRSLFSSKLLNITGTHNFNILGEGFHIERIAFNDKIYGGEYAYDSFHSFFVILKFLSIR